MDAEQPSILVVDDEVDVCRNLADIFTDLSYRVDIAHDGKSALELVRQHRYDVALLDLMMPGMDGVTLYYEMKKLQAGTVALLVTAHPNHPRAEAALGTGVWRLLSKPVDFGQMMKLIDEAVGQPLVLVVDDDADLCANMWDLLREYGYRCSLAHDVKAAIQQMKENHYKVILLDIQLPDGDGTEVFRAAHEINPATEVVVITGCNVAAEQKIQEIIMSGATALHKPLDLGRLLAILRQAGGATPPRGVIL
jgi:DNA-binding NtrC family response regulator